MTFVHGKGAFVSIDGDNISAYCTSVKFGRMADTHDVTTFGKGSKVYFAGLKDGTGTVEGVYDNTAVTGPGALLRPLVGGAAVVFLYRPEGTGTGKPQQSVGVIVSKYDETAPVADMVTWSAELQFSDAITDTTQ